MNVRSEFWRIILVAKILLGLVVVTAFFAKFNVLQFQDAYAHWPPGKKPNLSSRFSTWDAAHYLYLSKEGYGTGSPSCAFYPLWPAVIRLGSAITGGHPVAASMLIANALSVVGLWLFYRLIKRHYGADISRDAVILMLACPGALFFSVPYTESLYLVILMWFFWGLEFDRWTWIGVASFLLPLARPIGVFIVLPLAWHLYQRRKSQISVLRDPQPCLATGPQKTSDFWSALSLSIQKARLLPLVLLVFPFAGYAAYFGLMHAWTGNAFEGFDAQKVFPHSPSIRNMFEWRRCLNSFIDVQTLDGMLDSGVDRTCFILFLASLPLVYRLNKTWFFYMLPAGLIPALTSWFMSYRRYFMVLFPIFILLAHILAGSKSRLIFWGYVIALTILQALAINHFFNFYWAG
jgi:hypothetical protein